MIASRPKLSVDRTTRLRSRNKSTPAGVATHRQGWLLCSDGARHASSTARAITSVANVVVVIASNHPSDFLTLTGPACGRQGHWSLEDAAYDPTVRVVGPLHEQRVGQQTPFRCRDSLVTGRRGCRIAIVIKGLSSSPVMPSGRFGTANALLPSAVPEMSASRRSDGNRNLRA